MQYTYTITANKKPIHYKCPICEGNGNFLHNGYDVLCKKCNVSGKIHDSRQFVLAVCKVKVRRIDVGIGNDEDMNIKYRLNSVDKNIKVITEMKAIYLKLAKKLMSIAYQSL